MKDVKDDVKMPKGSQARSWSRRAPRLLVLLYFPFASIGRWMEVYMDSELLVQYWKILALNMNEMIHQKKRVRNILQFQISETTQVNISGRRNLWKDKINSTQHKDAINVDDFIKTSLQIYEINSRVWKLPVLANKCKWHISPPKLYQLCFCLLFSFFCLVPSPTNVMVGWWWWWSGGLPQMICLFPTSNGSLLLHILISFTFPFLSSHHHHTAHYTLLLKPHKLIFCLWWSRWAPCNIDSSKKNLIISVKKRLLSNNIKSIWEEFSSRQYTNLDNCIRN